MARPKGPRQAAEESPVVAPRRRGRPPGRKATAAAPPADPVAAADAAAPAASPAVQPRRRGRPPGSRSTTAGVRGTTVRGSRDPLTIEQIVAVEPPRAFRLNARDRVVAFTAEASGAQQLFTLSLRGGYPIRVTASEKPVSDPQWSPDGRRLAYVREEAIWVIEADGSRLSEVTNHPAGNTQPRWSPDGHRLAFISRRRGWSQVWVVDAPVPRRGRPAANPRAPQPRPLTKSGADVDSFEWSPDGRRLVVMLHPGEEAVAPIVTVDVADGTEEPVAADGWNGSASWTPDGGLLYVSDADGWFQVVHRSPDGRQLTTLTTGEVEHGEAGNTFGFGPLSAPDGSRFCHAEFRDGYVDLVVASMAAQPVKRGPGRPPRRPRPAGLEAGRAINPWPGVWRSIGWLADGAWIAAIGENEARPQDLWLLPVPGVAPAGARPRQVTDSLPTVVAAAFAPGRAIPEERYLVTARDGLPIAGTLWRPARATGRRGGERVATVIVPHGGPVAQALRSWVPFKHLLVREGFAVIDVDFRGSSGYGRDFRLANRDEWGHNDLNDVIDVARWAAAQPWSNGRLAIYGGSYGGYLVLAALVEEPQLFQAGVDLYGDSDIAESYRRGDRIGRLDLHRHMGAPDSPEASERYRRGSPVLRADRVEAPLLMLHGRKDKRVVPLMTERMAEALAIEGKYHEVQWYDDEGHGWEKLDTRRDAFGRILGFLRRHVLEGPQS